MAFPKLGFSLLLFILTVYQGYALQCWSCSSDLDPSCRDTFNASFFPGRYGGYNQNYNSRSYSSNPYNDQYNNRYNDPYNNQRNYQNDPYNRNDQYNRNDPYRNDPYRSDPYNNRNDPYRQQPYSQQYNSGRGIQLQTCPEEEARLKRMKYVCLKKVTSTNSYTHLYYVRRCEMVPIDQYAGTCYDPVSRGQSLDFCEYCEYDGCNAANGIKTNLIVALIAPLALLLFLSK